MSRTMQSNTNSTSHPLDMLLLPPRIVFDISLWAISGIFGTVFKKKNNFFVDEYVPRKRYPVMFDDSFCWSNTNNKRILYEDLPKNNHFLVVGSTGYGKTNSIIALWQKSYLDKRPFIFIAPKGSHQEIKEFVDSAKEYNFDYYLFVESEVGKFTYNPFKGLDAVRCTEIIMTMFDWSDSFYATKAQDALLQTIEYLNKKKLIVSFHSIYGVLKERVAKDKELRKETSGLMSSLSSLVNTHMGQIFKDEGNAICLKDIRDSQRCFYASCPVMGPSILSGPIGRMFVSELKLRANLGVTTDRNGKEYVDSHPLDLYIDEAGSFLTESCLPLYSQGREGNIVVYTAVQSLSDLDDISVNFRKRIIDNCNSYLWMKVNDGDNAKEIAKIIGTKVAQKVTIQVDDSDETGLGSIREGHEYIVSPDVLRRLSMGHAILVRQYKHKPADIEYVYVKNMFDPRNKRKMRKKVDSLPTPKAPRIGTIKPLSVKKKAKEESLQLQDRGFND